MTTLASRWIPALALLLLPATLAVADPAPPPPSEEQLAATHRRMAEGIRGALTDPCLASSRVGMLVRDLPAGIDVSSNREDEPFTPASNMKVLTAAAALDRLRPETVFRTSVVTAAEVRDGALLGDLYLVGGGDPGLVPESLFLLASRLRARGIESIRGDLVGDDSLFDQILRPVGWPERNFHRAFSAPHSALTVGYSSVSVRVRPTGVKQHVAVEVEPFPSFFDIQVQAMTSRRTYNLQVRRGYTNGRNTVEVTGYLPLSRGEAAVVRSVEDPTFYTLEGFRSMLELQGIEVEGDLRRGLAPETARELVYYESRPLYQLVMDLNKYSSNVMAEMLLKTLGAVEQGPPGTTAGGASVVVDWLREIGAPTEGVRILDGSGLTEESTLTPRTLVAALDHVWQDFEIRPEFWVSLPVGGTDGTLKRRLNGTGRRIRAKTGLVRETVTLSGYAYGPQDRPYAFSILVNDHKCPAWKVQKAIDDVVLAIVEP